MEHAEAGPTFVPAQPRQHLPRAVGRDENLGRPRHRYPFANVRLQGSGLSTVVGTVAGCGLVVAIVTACSSCDEAESLQNPTRLMGGEIRSVDPGDARDDLLGRKSASTHHDVVLADRIRKQVTRDPLDTDVVENERLTGDDKPWHT